MENFSDSSSVTLFLGLDSTDGEFDAEEFKNFHY